MKSSQKYQQLLQQPEFVNDPAQRQAIERLDHLQERLSTPRKRRGWRAWLGFDEKPEAVRGLYFWGGVGRGKTLLMDLFYQAHADNSGGRRIHFHSFMNEVHAALREQKALDNPLRKIAAEIATQTRVLCLDEFVIIDIGDAMIMSGLLEALFEHGVVLVTTSNVAPDDLYRDGLQRARFLPAIELLKQHCEVFNLDGGEDYRLRFLQQADLYTVPHDASVEQRLRDYVDQHVSAVPVDGSDVLVNGRRLLHRFCAGDTVWFDFAELCETTRSQNDYLELARFFNTIIVTGIRQMGRADDDIARRFVLLIDVLYDHHVKLICSASVSPDQLYTGQRLAFEFERTTSRLLEMQSAEYLAQAHGQQ